MWLASDNSTAFSPQDPNQLIRASALRVLSSVRVPIIAPIMMLAIKEAASDMSPYVRKTAAHAIPKLHRWDCFSLYNAWPGLAAAPHTALLFPICPWGSSRQCWGAPTEF